LTVRGLLPAAAAIYQQNADVYQDEHWRLTRVNGGANGIVYHAQSNTANQSDLAVKITQPDGRHRAEREYAATLALRLAGYDVCPHPIYHREHFPGLPGPLVISAWLAGERLETAPAPEDRNTWVAILTAMGEIHSLTPKQSRVHLRPAFFAAREPAIIMNRLHERMDRLPEGIIGGLRHEQIRRLLQTACRQLPERWEKPVDERLVLDDVNPRNMILGNGLIRFVDWEYSGWADPAFDLAGLCTMPAYFDLPAEYREWMKTEHSRILDDATLPYRSTVYEQLMLVFWVIKMSQSLVAGDERFAGVLRFDSAYHESFQTRYWEHTAPLFGL
jgi:thiamine kinase-like enzyme